MRPAWSRGVVGKWIRWLLTLLAAVCVLAALAKLRPLWRDFDTVHISLEFPSQPESSGARLDAVLLDNLPHLSYIRSFDHVFAAGKRAARIANRVWLDRCEVRQGDFYKFAGWRPFHPQAPITAPDQPPNWRHFSDSRDHAISGRLDAPATGLTWFDAYAYCRAAGGRLPRVDEWIAAAGGGHRLYPWGMKFFLGNSSDPGPWPYLDPLLNAARKCGEHPASNTPEGLADMGHSVSEWAIVDRGVADLGRVRGRRGAAVMGGNAYNAPRELYSLVALYRRAPARYRSPYLGFRCAYDAAPRATPWRTGPDGIALAAGDYAVGLPEEARIPSLLAHLPRARLGLIQRIFERRDKRSKVDLYLMTGEVTRREYAAFLGDPFVQAGFYAEDNQPSAHRHRPPDWEAQLAQPELPVVNVDWWSAYAFAAWAGGRLPTAEEWASAASGQGRRIYPWGDDFTTAAPVTGEYAKRGPQAVTPDNGDATPEGLLAMGGNVSEWTRSVSSASGSYAVIVKGGNYLLPGAATARLDYANHLSPNYRSPTLGFRVVFDRPR